MKYCLECLADKTFLSKIHPQSIKGIVHSGNKTKVLDDLIKNYDNSIGIIDEDPWSYPPIALKQFIKYANSRNNYFEILQDLNRNNFLIMLKPRLEEWVLQAALVSNLKVTDYDLPLNGDDLHAIININITNFSYLLDDLLRSNNACVKELCRYLH